MSVVAYECIPFLQVRDAHRSLDFYCAQLGFTKNWEHQLASSSPRVASISLGDATVFLTEHPESAPGALVYLRVSDVDHLVTRLRGTGVRLEWGPEDQPWGMREVQLRDPDGNKLRFGAETERSA